MVLCEQLFQNFEREELYFAVDSVVNKRVIIIVLKVEEGKMARTASKRYQR